MKTKIFHTAFITIQPLLESDFLKLMIALKIYDFKENFT